MDIAKKCIFCSEILGEDTKPEHILLNALGGRKKSKSAICSGCNNAFGSTIDAKLADQFLVIRNLLQQETGNGGAPPKLKNIPLGDGYIDIESDGSPVLKGSPLSVEPKGNGTFNVRVTARDRAHFETLIPHLARRMRTSEAKVCEQLKGQTFSIIRQRPGPEHMKIPLSFGGVDASRSLAKSCLCVLADALGNSEVQQEVYNDVRRFVVEGGEELYKRIVKVDTRVLHENEEVSKKYGPFFNMIYVRSDENGKVIARFTLYNICSWQIVLTESGGSPDFRVGLISNPLNCSNWSDNVGNEFDIEYGWLSSPAFDINDAHNNFLKLVNYCHERARSAEFERIVDSLCKKYGVEEGQDIPLDIRQKMIAEASLQFVSYMFSIPYEEKVTFEII